MTRIDELKTRLRNAPTIEATFAEIDGEYQKLVPHLNALIARRNALLSQLAQFESDRAELGLTGSTETKTGEPVPDPAPAAKPKLQGNRK